MMSSVCLLPPLRLTYVQNAARVTRYAIGAVRPTRSILDLVGLIFGQDRKGLLYCRHSVRPGADARTSRGCVHPRRQKGAARRAILTDRKKVGSTGDLSFDYDVTARYIRAARKVLSSAYCQTTCDSQRKTRCPNNYVF
ncbi:Hypp1695 [Branchiostoma lanceolatum]|uniref:Hypp1695 protein n=1 Tax=Branchiostoma lanceolatum TaxID=7740 RepID=A0A8J9ZM99_BRALA|nr:Hypp1695 [Branchiostoma lanceolatum]